MPVIVITRLRLRDPAFFDEFFASAVAVVEQAQGTEGNLAADVLAEANNTYWTRTAWQGRAAMDGFVGSEPHLSTMSRIDDWCDEATFVDWEQASSDARRTGRTATGASLPTARPPSSRMGRTPIRPVTSRLLLCPELRQEVTGRPRLAVGGGRPPPGGSAAQQPSYGAHGEVPASANSLANAASCTLTGAVCAPPG